MYIINQGSGNTIKMEGKYCLVKSMIYTVFTGFQTCCNKCWFFPSLDLVKFYPSLAFHPFETHFSPMSSNADFLKANSFAQSKFSDYKFCAETCIHNDIKHVKLKKCCQMKNARNQWQFFLFRVHQSIICANY